jgi:hypothetical protein
MEYDVMICIYNVHTYVGSKGYRGLEYALRLGPRGDIAKALIP